MTECTEIWENVVGYENAYEVSNLGHVRNKRTLKVLKPAISNKGYERVFLYHDPHNGKYLGVHRAVAMAFIPNPLNKPCVNHIDNNPLNNKIDNLEWVTYGENMQWASIQGRMSYTDERKERQREKQRRKMIAVIGTDKNGNEYFFDRLSMVDNIGFNSTKVSLCCRGIRKTCGGLTWRFATEEEKAIMQPSRLTISEWKEIIKKSKGGKQCKQNQCSA